MSILTAKEPLIKPHWPQAGGSPTLRAQIKSLPADFHVSENLEFEPAGDGEHLYLRVEKTNLTSLDVAQRLARLHAVPASDVGFAGMKDKRAVCEQWFSLPGVQSPSPEFDYADGGGSPGGLSSVRLIQTTRHPKKLRRGQLLGNSFQLRLRNLGDGDAEAALQQLSQEGAPNYFGSQRFGWDNLQLAEDWLKVRRSRRVSAFKKGLYLSVLRSFLFNEVLALRVTTDNWRLPIAGDLLEDGQPTGPLWGRGRSPVSLVAAELESSALSQHAEICEGLEYAGVQQQRRSLVLQPDAMRWQRDCQDELQVGFTLPAGGYATTLLSQAFELTVLERDE